MTAIIKYCSNLHLKNKMMRGGKERQGEERREGEEKWRGDEREGGKTAGEEERGMGREAEGRREKAYL